MWPGDPHVRVLGEVPQAAGGGVPIHRALRLLSRIGPLARPATARSMARPTAGGSGTQDDLGALAAHPQHAVAVFLAQVGDAGAGGFEDPQGQQPEHGHQGEVVIVRRLARGGQQRLELQVSEPERGRFGRDIRPADMLGRECSSTPSMTQVR